MKLSRNFGIEIEVEGLSWRNGQTALRTEGITEPQLAGCTLTRWHDSAGDRRPGMWTSETDGSLDAGTELISPLPCTYPGDDSNAPGEYKDTSILFKVNQIACDSGAVIRRTCGTHMSVDVTDIADNLDAMKRLSRLWLSYEATMFTLVSASRRSNGLCRTNRSANSTATAAWNKIGNAVNLRDLWSAMNVGGERYMAMNMASVASQNRIEFRLHQGTLNATKMERFLELLCLLVDAAANGVDATTPPANWNRRVALASMLNHLSGGTQDAFDFPRPARGHYRNSRAGRLWKAFDERASDLERSPSSFTGDSARRLASHAISVEPVSISGVRTETYDYAIVQVSRWRARRAADAAPVAPATSQGNVPQHLLAFFTRRQSQLS